MSQFIPNSFQVPNAFIDEVLDKISGNACKIYLLIVRKTRGWNKKSDRLSYSQIQKSAGIGSSATVDKAIGELVDLNLISYKQGNEKYANEYQLNDDFSPNKGTSKNEVQKNCSTSKNEVATSKNEVQGTSKNEDTEIHNIKYTSIKNNSNTREKKFISADDLVNLGIDRQVAKDFLATRKTKLTQTALQGIVKQAELAGVTLNDAIAFTVIHGWQSFKADWYHNRQPKNRMDDFAQQAAKWANFYGDDDALE